MAPLCKSDFIDSYIVQTFSIFGNKEKAIDLCISRFDDDTKAAFLDLYNKVDAGTLTASSEVETEDFGPKETDEEIN